ncbi:MAG TPA: CopG family transcriptional regulator [Candidatus Hydrothermia bacterium]|nr:CopG family transcriptional regulator [Candidatus Hydrothermae bacterium]MDD3648568.1 CopG family transcriptional regulator [Candidatus Hydrothermia bacterium]HOK22572.1 CopG family transcriptional regulator [Candidatus Hydrothermia bacterium]HOL23279.1 CopG family transcriptional regulator [Candidatus Hydrothermia bacterium]HOP32898.1 CopG family transcriptional regulator [Candidatus Hydrothermia bacterium]
MENKEKNEDRVGLVGIFVNDKEAYKSIQGVISLNSNKIFGRAGFNIPEVTVIVLLFRGTTDEIGAFTGKLGKIKGVQVKTLLKKEL